MNAPGERKLQVGHGLFDPLRGDLSLGGRTIRLRPRTAALLSHLVQHRDRVVSKDELMRAVWPDVVVTEDSIGHCVKEIRQALGENGREWIRTLPRQGYAFVADPPEQQQPTAAQPWAPRWRLLAAFGLLAMALASALAWRFWPASPAPEWSVSIVVLPIANLTGDSAQDRAADELTEAITDVLGRGRVKVIALSTARTYKDKPVDVRNVGEQLGVRYVLQGSLRKDEARPLRLRLADAATSIQLWQQDFKVSPGFPELREDVPGGILPALGNQLIRAEARRSGSPDIMRAAELVDQARAVLRGAGSETEKNLRAQALLEQAVRLNDDLGTAWVVLAGTYLHDLRFSPTRQEQLKRAGEAIERAVKLIPTSDGVLAVQSRVYYEQGRLAEALKLSERSIELNPSNATAMGMRGWTLLALARPQEALVQIETAMRTSPRDPTLPGLQMAAGVAHLHLAQDAAAVQALAQAAKAMPQSALARLYLAGALGAAGRVDEARAEMAQFEQLRPGFTLSRFRAAEQSSAPAFLKQRQRLYEGLRRAGMQD